MSKDDIPAQHWTRLKPNNADFQKPEYCVKITFTKYQTDTSNLRKMRDFNGRMFLGYSKKCIFF